MRTSTRSPALAAIYDGDQPTNKFGVFTNEAQIGILNAQFYAFSSVSVGLKRIYKVQHVKAVRRRRCAP